MDFEQTIQVEQPNAFLQYHFNQDQVVKKNLIKEGQKIRKELKSKFSEEQLNEIIRLNICSQSISKQPRFEFMLKLLKINTQNNALNQTYRYYSYNLINHNIVIGNKSEINGFKISNCVIDQPLINEVHASINVQKCLSNNGSRLSKEICLFMKYIKKYNLKKKRFALKFNKIEVSFPVVALIKIVNFINEPKNSEIYLQCLKGRTQIKVSNILTNFNNFDLRFNVLREGSHYYLDSDIDFIVQNIYQHQMFYFGSKEMMKEFYESGCASFVNLLPEGQQNKNKEQALCHNSSYLGYGQYGELLNRIKYMTFQQIFRSFQGNMILQKVREIVHLPMMHLLVKEKHKNEDERRNYYLNQTPLTPYVLGQGNTQLYFDYDNLQWLISDGNTMQPNVINGTWYVVNEGKQIDLKQNDIIRVGGCEMEWRMKQNQIKQMIKKQANINTKRLLNL